MLRSALAVAAAMACMELEAEAAMRLLGPARAQPGPAAALAYRSEIFGIGWGPHGLVIGWSREDGASVPSARAPCTPGS